MHFEITGISWILISSRKSIYRNTNDNDNDNDNDNTINDN